MKKALKKTLKFLLSLAVAVLFIYWAFSGIDLAEFWRDLIQTRWGYILLSVVAAYLALILRAERWRMQLMPLSRDITRRSIWHGSNIGNALSIVLPGVGEFARCAYVSGKNATYNKTFGTIITERAWDVIAIFSLLVIAMLTESEKLQSFVNDDIITPFRNSMNMSFWWGVGAAVILLAAAIFIIWKLRKRSKVCRRVIYILNGVWQGVATFSKMNHGWAFMIYTVAIWTMYIFMTYFTFLAIPGLDNLTFADAVFISAVGNIASVIPTPGNIGPYHWLVGMAISNIYLGAAEMTNEGLLCATLSHGSRAILLIILGLVSYTILSLDKKKDISSTESKN